MSEADEQRAVVDFCRLLDIPVYHIPNEGKRSVATGRRMAAEGLSKGVPDLCIPVARGAYHSLYIEMKGARGKISPEQGEWIMRLRDEGMCAGVCFGADVAIKVIRAYMALDEGKEI